MKRINKTISIIMMAAMVFAAVPVMGGNSYAAAAKKPARVSKVWLYTNSSSAIKVRWRKVKKGLTGYVIYRNGKAVKTVKKSVTSFTDKGLSASTKYTYKVRAYKNAKVKQWFNTKTQKWQTEKPAKKYRGESRTVKKKLYGKASVAVSLRTLKARKTKSKSKAKTTKEPSATFYGYTAKASECPKLIVEKGTSPCPRCGEGGTIITITYENGKFKGSKYTGPNYLNKCHHCDNFEVVGCTNYPPLWFTGSYDENKTDIDSGFEINLKDGLKASEQTMNKHKHSGEDCKSRHLAKGNVYCRMCHTVVTKPASK